MSDLARRVEKLAPCPFCGCTDIKLFSLNEGWCAVCQNINCGVRLPYEPSESACIETWNRRALLAPREEEPGLRERRADFVSGAMWFASLKWLPQSSVPEEVAEKANEEAQSRYEQYQCIHCQKAFPRTGQGWADCMNHQQGCTDAALREGLESAAWDMLHAVEAADAAGELADNIGGEVIDALRAELTPPRISEGRRALSACAPMESKSYTCTHCEKAFPRSSQGWADCMNHQQNCKGERNEAV